MFEVQTIHEYDKDYYKYIDEAKKELREKARPEIKAYPENFDSYDTIFVAYPNWQGTMPMFLHRQKYLYDKIWKKDNN